MSKKDKIEKELSFLQEEFRGYFLILIALLTGEAGLIYAVVSGEKPIYVLLLAVVGMVLVAFLYSKVAKIKDIIYSRLEELEKE